MATKNISITEEAYRRLAALGEANESFSQIITRLTGRKSLMKFAGVLSDRSASKMEKRIGRNLKRFDKERASRRQRLRREIT